MSRESSDELAGVRFKLNEIISLFLDKEIDAKTAMLMIVYHLNQTR